jgi:hypothetical protein
MRANHASAIERHHHSLHLEAVAGRHRDAAKRQLTPSAKCLDERALRTECRAAGGIVQPSHGLPRFLIIGSDLDGNDALTGRRDADVEG